jgi:hypothetical protein
MNHFILKFISLIHILFILFIVIIPFTNSNYFLLLHIVITPFLMLHWVVNDNTCALTLLEKYVRSCIDGVPCTDNISFMANLINPIYDFKQNHEEFSNAIYLITITLWLVSIIKLFYKIKSGEIKTLIDLTKINF